MHNKLSVLRLTGDSTDFKKVSEFLHTHMSRLIEEGVITALLIEPREFHGRPGRNRSELVRFFVYDEFETFGAVFSSHGHGDHLPPTSISTPRFKELVPAVVSGFRARRED
jgi:L-ascorbate metabolism protein UlaG (beta-lactamase superfamily)